MFLGLILASLGLDMLFSHFPGPVLGSMIVLSVLGASWVSLLTVSLLDVLGLSVYALALNATAVFVATRSPLAPPGWALAVVSALYSLGVMLATVCTHALGRSQESRQRALQQQAPAEQGLRRAAHSPDAPEELPSRALPPGAEPTPAREFIRTDGTRAFCCGDRPWPAWIFQEGRWQTLAPPPRPPSMEWPKAVGVTADGRLFLKTEADVSYDAHVEQSCYCDCWYWLGEGKAQEVEPTPPIRDWWGTEATPR
jgi:hypothetical protein